MSTKSYNIRCWVKSGFRTQVSHRCNHHCQHLQENCLGLAGFYIKGEDLQIMLYDNTYTIHQQEIVHIITTHTKIDHSQKNAISKKIKIITIILQWTLPMITQDSCDKLHWYRQMVFLNKTIDHRLKFKTSGSLTHVID